MFVKEKYKCFSEDCGESFVIGYSDSNGLDAVDHCPFCGSTSIIPQIDTEDDE